MAPDKGEGKAKSAKTAAREARLAEKLRANLARRKGQQRGRTAKPGDDPRVRPPDQPPSEDGET